MNRTEGFDEFGNPVGHAFNLGGGDEDRIRGEKVLLYICPISDDDIDVTELQKIMSERGLQMDVRRASQYGAGDLSESVLAGYSQLWYVSGQTQLLSRQQVQMVADYVGEGNGLAIWADNEPYYADANQLALAVAGTGFSGNRMADRVMVPGPPRTPGRFVEHALTQGVNNLYEGVTICTIREAPGVSILGQSHDGQLCLGCFERGEQRVVLDTGFTKLYRTTFRRSAGLARYLSNIAFWLARGSRGVEYQLLTPGRKEIASLGKGETSNGYQFTVTDPTAATCILQWEGPATLGLSVRGPGGDVVGKGKSATSPLRVSVRADIPGVYVANAEGVDVTSGQIRYVLTLTTETAPRQSGVVSSGQTILPFYLICDVSAGMANGIDDLNIMLRHIKRDLMSDGSVDSMVRLSVIAFNDSARTVVPLAAPSQIQLPTLTAGGGLSYNSAVREFHRVFEQEHTKLKASGAKVSRATVFFLIHGEPAEADFAQTFRSVLGYDPVSSQGNRAYPNVVAIGFEGASEHTLATMAYPDFGDREKRGRWFRAESGTTTRQLFKSVVGVVGHAARSSQIAAGQGKVLFSPPTSIPGTSGGIC